MPAKRKKTTRTKRSPVSAAMPKPLEPMYQPVVKSGPSLPIIILLMVASFLAGYFYLKVKNLEQEKANTTAAAPQQQAPTTVTLDAVKKLFGNGYMHFGDAKRKVLFVEVSDPSCPYCHVAGGQDPSLAKDIGSTFQYNTEGGSYIPPVTEMRKLVDEGKASYVQLYAPGHGNGELGAQALYCAYDQNKFWEVHDKLMSDAGYNIMNTDVKNDVANLPKLTDFLSDVIDPSYLDNCIKSGKYAQTLKRDEQVAQSLGYQGTPHFIVNTDIFAGAQSYEAMKPIVDKLLK